MSNDLNLCQFIGRLGKDVDTRYTSSGEAVASFSLAVGIQWKDKQGTKQESTEWIPVSAFGKLAEICSEYLKKGSQIYVSGRWKTEKYTTKDGIEKYSTKLIADRMLMLCGKSEPREAQEQPKRPQTSDDPFDDDVAF